MLIDIKMTENNNDFEDLDNVCRLCLSTTTLVSIFNNDDFESTEGYSMRHVVEVTTGVKISPKDEVSHKLCNKCSHLIIRIFKFRNASMMNDRELKEKASKRKIHKSVKDILKQDRTLIVPSSISKCNVSPVVILNRNIAHYSKKNRIKSLKRRISRDQHMQTTPSTDENLPKKSKSAVELEPSSSNATDQESADHQRNVSESPEIPSSNQPNMYNPVGQTVEQQPQVEQKLEDEDAKLPLFTIKPITKSIFICDFCNKVHYTTKELKKHRTTHMHCRLCRTSFTSIEEVKKHQNLCSVKIIIDNQPRVSIERCDENEDVRKKYSEAFENFIIEISDDEIERAEDDAEIRLKEKEESNSQTELKNSNSDVDAAKCKSSPVIVYKEAVIKVSREPSSPELANKVIKESDGKEYNEKPDERTNFGDSKTCSNNFEKSKLNFQNYEGEYSVKNTESCKPNTPNKNPVNLKLNNRRKPITIKILRKPESTCQNSHGNYEISHIENSKEESRISDPERSETIPHLEKSEKGVNILYSDLLETPNEQSILKTTEIISHIENIQEKSNTENTEVIPEMQNNVIKGNDEKFETTIGISNNKSSENMFNTESNDYKFNDESSEQKSNCTNTRTILQKENMFNTEKSNIESSTENGHAIIPEKSIFGLILPEKSNVGKSVNGPDSSKDNPENIKTIYLKQSERMMSSKNNYIDKYKEFTGLKASEEKTNHSDAVSDFGSKIKKSVVIENTSKGKSQPAEANIEQAKEIDGFGTSKEKYNPEYVTRTDKLPSSNIKLTSNPEDSGLISSMNKSEKDSQKSGGMNSLTKLSINLERICTSPKSLVSRTEIPDELLHKPNDSTVHIKILKPANSKKVHEVKRGKKKRKSKKEGHSKTSKKLKGIPGENLSTQASLSHENKNNMTMGDNNKSPTDSYSFKPCISLGEIDILEVGDTDDDNTYLQNLLEEMKKSRTQVKKAVQTTDLPSNSEISNSKGDTFFFQLKNLRNYLNFSHIPVNISYAKTPSIKYTYENSSTMKSQEKLKIRKSKETNSSVRNARIILINEKPYKRLQKQSESSSAIKALRSDSCNVPIKQTSFQSNFRIESVTTLSAKKNPSKNDDKIRMNIQPIENLRVYSNYTIPDEASATSNKSIDLASPSVIVDTNTVGTDMETLNQDSNQSNLTTTSNFFPENPNGSTAPQMGSTGNRAVSSNTAIPLISYSMDNIPAQLTTSPQYFLINNSNSNGGIVSTPLTMIASAPVHSSSDQTFDANSQMKNSNPSVSSSLANNEFTPEVSSTPRLPPPLHQIRFMAPMPTSRKKSIPGITLLNTGVVPDIVPESRLPLAPSVPRSVISDSPSTVTHASQINAPNQIFVAPRAPPLNRNIPSKLSKIRVISRVASGNSVRLPFTKTTKDRANCDNMEATKKIDEASILNEHSNHAFPVSSNMLKYIRVKNLADLK